MFAVVIQSTTNSFLSPFTGFVLPNLSLILRLHTTVSLALVISYTPEYPDEAPIFGFDDVNGLDEDSMEDLRSTVAQAVCMHACMRMCVRAYVDR